MAQGVMDGAQLSTDLQAAEGRGLLASGTATVQVGATLRVQDRQPAGHYHGTYLVTFPYD
jgi:hypothetical protein